jgi:RimJ/RimL family protein N-acetyltransferase
MMKELIFTSRSGRQYTIRDLQPEDADLLVDLFFHLSPETIYKRFHAALDNLPEEHVRQEATRLANIDPENQIALVALHVDQANLDREAEAVGVARCHRVPGTTDAESAIVIRDDFQQDGLGTYLMTLLRERALEMGIEHLIAMVQAQNHPILKVIQRSGLESKWRFEQGVSYLTVDIRNPEIDLPTDGERSGQ